MATRRTTVGSAGESVAARFLERRGATVVRRNLRIGSDEIDLIVRMGSVLIAIEVKTGVGPDSRPWENFDAAKRSRTRRAARRLGVRRIDLVTVEFTGDRVAVRWLPESA
ncbi:MAG: YraN family protein [Acidimicrobiia bacterium]|jgi:putative endonuclease